MWWNWFHRVIHFEKCWNYSLQFVKSELQRWLAPISVLFRHNMILHALWKYENWICLPWSRVTKSINMQGGGGGLRYLIHAAHDMMSGWLLTDCSKICINITGGSSDANRGKHLIPNGTFCKTLEINLNRLSFFDGSNPPSPLQLLLQMQTSTLCLASAT